MSKIEFFEQQLKQEIQWRSGTPTAIAMEQACTAPRTLRIYPKRGEVLFSIGDIIVLANALGLCFYVNTWHNGVEIVPSLIVFE